METSLIRAYAWDDKSCQWAGWWEGDPADPMEFPKAYLRQRDPGPTLLGKAFDFDIPNGYDWSPHEVGVDRYVMEAAQVDFYSGTFTLEGFVHMERYGKRPIDRVLPGQSSWGGEYLPFVGLDKAPAAGVGAIYAKQRWVVML